MLSSMPLGELGKVKRIYWIWVSSHAYQAPAIVNAFSAVGAKSQAKLNSVKTFIRHQSHTKTQARKLTTRNKSFV